MLLALSLTVVMYAAGSHAKTPETPTQLSVSGAAAANTPFTFEQISAQYMQNPKVVGEARLKIMFWKIYDAKLAAANGEWKKDTSFALSLTYLRDFDGEEIASRSVDEMRDIGYEDEVLLAKWFEQMRSVFPNVKEGENITGVMDENQHTHFYYEGRLIGSIDDKSFGQSFFDIWLNEKTSEPKMRKQLLGLQ
ncbi:MAG: hypothetical protein ACJAYN_000965 [Bermanella sp.]|jgi:hypothetical protein